MKKLVVLVNNRDFKVILIDQLGLALPLPITISQSKNQLNILIFNTFRLM